MINASFSSATESLRIFGDPWKNSIYYSPGHILLWKPYYTTEALTDSEENKKRCIILKIWRTGREEVKKDTQGFPFTPCDYVVIMPATDLSITHGLRSEKLSDPTSWVTQAKQWQIQLQLLLPEGSQGCLLSSYETATLFFYSSWFSLSLSLSLLFFSLAREFAGITIGLGETQSLISPTQKGVFLTLASLPSSHIPNT